MGKMINISILCFYHILQILICVFFQEYLLSETSGFTENNSESDFKTLLTLKSFLGIISDVRKPNEEHCLTAEGILGKGLIFYVFF